MVGRYQVCRETGRMERRCGVSGICLFYLFILINQTSIITRWMARHLFALIDMHAICNLSSQLDRLDGSCNRFHGFVYFSKNFAKFFNSSSHRIFRHIHKVLNIDENKN